MYQLEGTIKLINDIQTFQSGFQKREFVVSTDEQYPQDVKFECVKDKCALLDNVSPGQRVSVSFRIRGNEYQGRYYVNLQSFKVDAVGGGGGGGGASEAPEGYASGDGVEDDPFANESSPF